MSVSSPCSLPSDEFHEPLPPRLRSGMPACAAAPVLRSRSPPDNLTSKLVRRRELFQKALFFLDAVGKVWALPYTCAGLVLGVPFLLAGARWQVAHNAIVFHRFPLAKRAFVMGNVIFSPYADLNRMVMTYECAVRARRGLPLPQVRTVHLGRHEEAHTWQYQLLGPLFLPLYLLTLFLPSPTPFERAADLYAHTGKGWWPWPRTAFCRRRK